MTFFNIFVKSVLLAYDKKLNFHCTKRTKMIKKIKLIDKVPNEGLFFTWGIIIPSCFVLPEQSKMTLSPMCSVNLRETECSDIW